MNSKTMKSCSLNAALLWMETNFPVFYNDNDMTERKEANFLKKKNSKQSERAFEVI
jgi:hypothetical protein